jgi:hypothetical protein
MVHMILSFKGNTESIQMSRLPMEKKAYSFSLFILVMYLEIQFLLNILIWLLNEKQRNIYKLTQ